LLRGLEKEASPSEKKRGSRKRKIVQKGELKNASARISCSARTPCCLVRLAWPGGGGKGKKKKLGFLAEAQGGSQLRKICNEPP